MVDFNNRMEVAAWLRNMSLPAIVVLAARAAARCLPAIAYGVVERRDLIGVLAAFRATAIARVAATYPHRMMSIRGAAHAAARFATIEQNFAAEKANFSSRSAGRLGYEARAEVDALFSATSVAWIASSEASGDAAEGLADMSRTAASSIAAAANAEIRPESDDNYSKDVFNIAWIAAMAAIEADTSEKNLSARLWPREHQVDRPLPGMFPALPDVIGNIWMRLKSSLLRRSNENWQVWTDWYDCWHVGRNVFPVLAPAAREQLEVDICLIPDADWQEGPAHVNALIAAMIEKAHSQTLPPPQPPVPDDEAPPQRPSAVVPVWQDDRLVQSRAPVVAGDDQRLLAASLLALRRDIEQFSTDFDAWIAECVAERGQPPQVRLAPLRYLRDLGALMPDEPPPLADLFRILHAREALKGQIRVVEDEWPNDFAARFASIARQFDHPARLSRDWRALTGEAERPPSSAIAEAPRIANEFVQALDAPGDEAIVDRGLLDIIRDMASRLAAGLGEERDDPLGPDKDLLGLDLIEGVNNVLKRLAEAGLAVRDSKLGRRSVKELATGFRVELPKQTKKLGKALAKIAVWSPLLAGGGWIATQMSWFAPIWKVIAPFLK